MSIFITGDISPTIENYNEFINSRADRLIGNDLDRMLKQSALVLANLETPLFDGNCPIRKHGPNLKAPAMTVNGIKEIGINVVTLANNHIMDHGYEGLDSTVKALKEKNIECFGCQNYNGVTTCYKRTINNKVYCFLGCTEHEFSISREGMPGANPYDEYTIGKCIHQLRRECDYLVVLFHGGKEEYRFPTPELQARCRFMISAGANLIICQHSHCVGCQEEYSNGKIIYGQGNFIFCLKRNEYWHSGLLIEITENFVVKYHPIIQTEIGVRLADSSEGKDIIEAFNERSELIKKENFTQNEFELKANELYDYYIEALYGKRTILEKCLNKLSLGHYTREMIKKRYPSEMLIRIINYIECETHRETMIKALKDRAGV